MGNLNKVTYTDHQTVITAGNLNDIQDSIIQNTSYVTCSTGASTAAKTATLANFVLTTGSAVKVKFTNTNTAANPTLNVNSTGAKPIMQYGTTVAGTTATESWDDGAVVEFVYDGTNWVMQGRNTIDAVSKANGGTFSGDVNIVKPNSGTGAVISKLTLGNNTAYGTVGNTYGALEIYSGQTQKATIYAGNPTADRELTCPDASGTIALTDNPTNIAIRNANGVANQDNLLALTLGNSTPKSQAGHSEGFIASYGNNGYYTAIQANDATANRQIKFPDESGTIALKEPRTLSSGADLNNLYNATDSGLYSIATGVANSPADWCRLIVNGGSGCSQIVINPNRIWIRMYTGSPLAWTSWRMFRPDDITVTNFTSGQFTTYPTLTYTGVNFTIPTNSEYNFRVVAQYQNSAPQEIVLSTSASEVQQYRRLAQSNVNGEVCLCGYAPTEFNVYVWARYASQALNNVMIRGVTRIIA